MATITVMDPVTRIEGHMKVEVTIDGTPGNLKVVDARCTGTQFRGFETILVGRHPFDAPILTERICGVCPVSHGMASSLALDKAAGVTPPANARIMRNLVLGANFVQSHILHFYLLAAFDFVQGPGSAPWTPAWDVDMRPGVERIVATSLPKAIEARRRAHEMGSIFGGRIPSPHTFVPGGFTAVPTAARIQAFRDQLNWMIPFIRNTYLEDVNLLAGVYDDYYSIGKGTGNLMAYGVFDLDNAGTTKLLKRGLVRRKTLDTVRPLRAESITESVGYSWYEDATEGLQPINGATAPVYPKGDAYSWIKAPRYGKVPMETGPLARMWVNGDYGRGISVMDRHVARAQETLKVAEAMLGWLDELTPGASVFNTAVSTQSITTGQGIGLTEAPRGALGHWVKVDAGKISHYQVITPTCWNASPRDANGVKGPIERALVGTPIEKADQPVEALRVIHSFDPCLSCAVHVMRPDGKPVVVRAGIKG